MNLVFPQCNSDFIFSRGHQVRCKVVSGILTVSTELPTDKLSRKAQDAVLEILAWMP